MSKIVNGGRYVTAKQAQVLRNQGKAVQVGNYIDSKEGYRRLMHRDSESDVMGICLNNTNPNKSVGKRSYELFMNKGTINLEEVVSAHMAKGQMSTIRLKSEIDRLGHLANKIDASRSILTDQLWATK